MLSTFQLLSPEECDRIVNEIDENCTWAPGVSPSDAYANKVKRNMEIPMGNQEEADKLHNAIIARILECEFFKTRTLPKHLGRPRFNLCEDGGHYGWHADSAFMGNNPEIRTDVSMTIFLTDPETYEGGELQLRPVSGQPMNLRGRKGQMVFYPSGIMHQVTPVTKGRRIAFVCWTESHIQDSHKRDILVEMTELCQAMESIDNLGEVHTRMLNIKHNLFRQWMKLT